MIKIEKATLQSAKLLAKISVASFLPAHGHSAPKKDIDSYISNNFNEKNFIEELSNSNFQYYIIYYKGEVAGYSKIVFNSENEIVADKNITLMSRLYLLKEFYGLNLGKEFFNFNVELAKKNNQKGIWLAVWVENAKAISFYKKMGFKKVGDYDFRISETHSNPNHILYLEF
ncbi:GNAT family N-acetyltransferase [Polaribacter pectinis]|uniref:GNAT family N-acetyltransferase n=1 Tax=Polaribacter pectinis TaxID=2738844 RepID=A0A7G9LEG3_9FLAO|nr:GNAT family N-acetyltransferase [Polaribacter pectinis]QNM87012.1 GNAT family N-acetyltransferase [Polaribacter pectinis]